MDPSEYLQPDFNPASYKVAQLRNVLLQNDVSYPTGAKKQDLINIFNKNIKPSSITKLKELNSVVADDSGIEVVGKKKIKKSEDGFKVENLGKSKLKNSTVASNKRDYSPVRKSPRKVSGSKSEGVEVKKTSKKSSSKRITEVPDLQKERSRIRERSPTRKTSLKHEEERVFSSKSTTSTKRERSPSKRQPKPQPEPVAESESESGDDSDIEQVTEAEFNKSSNSNVDLKAETSFSNENVFQSPDPSPQFVKSIPKKRANDEDSKSPKKSAKRKTAFSSSPIAETRSKSPTKKSLEIPKFETPASSEVLSTDDIFNFGKDNEIKLDEVIERSPIKTSPLKKSELEEFQTPKGVYQPNIFNNRSPVTEEIRSKIPDFSKFKVSAEFANNFISKIEAESYNEKSAENEIEDEIPDVLDEPIDDGSYIDSELFDLQKDIEDVKAVILEEAEEAVKQINEIFHDNEEKQANDFEAPKKPFNFMPIFSFIKQLVIFVTMVAVVISGLWYREQRILIGYCGSEIDQPTFPNISNEYLLQVEDFLQTIKPNCLRCPNNAICLPNMQLKCKEDYIVHEPWYKLYGVLPFEDYCIKDQEKEDIINEILSKSLELLRTRNANTKCGDGEDLEVGISDDELYEFFFQSKKSTISDEEFNELWVRVLEDLKNEPEITLQYKRDNDSRSSSDDLSTNEDEEETSNIPTKIVFRSNSHVKLSIACKFQKEVYERFQSNKEFIFITGLINLVLIFIYFKFKSYQKQQSKVNEISDIIITKLQKQTKTSIVDPTGLTNRYLSAIQLRDELLANLNNSNKFKLWDLILVKLEKNSNIRSSTKEIHGEIVKVLEWIGE